MHNRTKLSKRKLPAYTSGEELVNTITHAIGIPLGIAVLALCLLRAEDARSRIAATLYGASMTTVYAVSAIYHGLRPGTAKKVMQIIDHCTIYFLIAGSYTAVVLPAMAEPYPALAWGLLAFEWLLAAIAATLTAIDLKKYNIFSMVCYIGMGWAVIPFWQPTLQVLTLPGFLLLLLGGITYSVGAVLYGLGTKRKWMHSIFHLFVLLGSLLQFLAIFLYAL